MDLRQYEQAKFELAAILRSADLIAKADKQEEWTPFGDLSARLAEDRFNLVVVGRFNRGKTSLMNALLQTTRLPVGVVPVTSVITTVAYGSDEAVFVEHRGGLPERVPIERLPEYVTQQGNPGNVRDVTTARVELPSAILRRGFHFIDTPGLGSSIAESARTTLTFLPEADAVIVVTSYDSPLSEEELGVLDRLASSGRPVFLVVNKSDIVSTTDRSEIVNHIRDQVSRVFGPTVPQIFSVSARRAVEANESGDRGVRWTESGLPALEEQLTRFLVEEKQSEFLYRMCERVAEALRGLPNCVSEVTRLDQLRRGVARHRPKVVQVENTASAESVIPVPRFSKCPVCTQIEHAIFSFLFKYQNSLVVSENDRVRLAECGGLCEFHTWHYDAVASPRGTCIAFADVLSRFAARLREIAVACEPGSVAEDIGALMPAEGRCEVCRVRFQAERAAIIELAESISGEQPDEMVRFSGLCFSHLRLLAASVRDTEIMKPVLRAEADLLERVSEDMHRYVLRYDGRSLPSAEERNAAQHGLMLLAGHRDVNGARR
jgi:small GTP-binding protein